MAGHVLKKRRLVNPRRRRRNMSAKQIRFFGTKRQKAALRNRRRNRGRRNQGIVTEAEHAAQRAIQTVERAAEDAIGTVTHAVANRGRRRRNVGEILTVIPANPGRRRRRRNRGMARTKNRRRTNRRHNVGRARNRARTRNYRRRNYRRRNYGHRRRSNRRSNPRVIVRYRNRRSRNYGRRRRNQGVFAGGLGGDVGKVLSLLGGATVTGLITGFLPTNWMTGWGGYLTTGLVAVVAGQVAGRAMRKPQLGNWITVGGLLIVALDVLKQFFPQLQLPFATTTGSAGTSGMGLITSSNFFVPQVNVPGSMASFVAPAAIPAAAAVAAPAASGLGALRTYRRVGRFR
jgi:hypothetical protein